MQVPGVHWRWRNVVNWLFRTTKSWRSRGKRLKWPAMRKTPLSPNIFLNFRRLARICGTKKISICWIWEHSALLSEGLSDRSPNCRCLESWWKGWTTCNTSTFRISGWEAFHLCNLCLWGARLSITIRLPSTPNNWPSRWMTSNCRRSSIKPMKPIGRWFLW